MIGRFDARDRLIRRIFVLQLILIVVTCVLVVVAVRDPTNADGSESTRLGTFWFAFVAGVFGASIALLRRVTRGEIDGGYLFKDDWILTLSPFLYGGLLAGIVYFLFVSKLVSGDAGGGLITTNLFPNFNGAEVPENGRVEMIDFLAMRPASLSDVAKLLVWCLLAGYSENFVTGILSNLESRGSMAQSDPTPQASVVNFDGGRQQPATGESLEPLDDPEYEERFVDPDDDSIEDFQDDEFIR